MWQCPANAVFPGDPGIAQLPNWSIRCSFPGVVAVSYAWIRIDHPDPQRAQLLALRPVLVWYLCERARRKRSWGESTMQTTEYGVFIDFMSMHQPDDYSNAGPGTPPTYSCTAQQASFGRALKNIGLLYGHASTMVLKLTMTPVGGDPDRVYSKRGWTHLERRLSDLDKPHCNSLDVAAWPGRLVELCESEERLATQADHTSFRDAGTLGLLCCERGAPSAAAHFNEELRATKLFGYTSDYDVCERLYRGVAEPLLAGMRMLAFHGLVWTLADWRHLGGALASCRELLRLELRDMSLDDAGVAALFSDLGSGSMPALERLILANNQIGDEGVRLLGDALSRNVAPVLNPDYLVLSGNPAADCTCQAVAGTLTSRGEMISEEARHCHLL